MQKPKQDDYLPFYSRYVELVEEGNVLDQLQRQGKDILQMFGALTEEQGAYRYEEGKWSLKEVFGHIIDAERIMTYRLLRVARGDTTPLPGFDQNAYVAGTDFNRRPIGELAEEHSAVRAGTIALLRSLTTEELQRAGTAGNGRVTACALAFIVTGHASHHLNIVRERYLPGLPVAH